MKLVIFLELFCLVALAMATRRSRNNGLAVYEKRTSDVTLWKRTSILDQSLIIPLKVALAQSNLEKAEDLLMSVSHPASSNFSQHWTAKDVAQRFAPSTEAISSVAVWIRQSGIGA